MKIFVGIMIGVFLGMLITVTVKANQEQKEIVILREKMQESKYQYLTTQSAKDYNKFVDWWLKEIDAILKGGNE